MIGNDINYYYNYVDMVIHTVWGFIKNEMSQIAVNFNANLNIAALVGQCCCCCFSSQFGHLRVALHGEVSANDARD
jgi:hypothetical protein